MSQNCERKKYCNCPISSDKTILEPFMDHSFCEKCGSILIKDMQNNETIYYTIKPKQKQKPTELNPIQIIRSMKKKTETDFPFLNNEYNMSGKELENKEETMKSIDIYLNNRKMIIMTIQKMMKMLDVSDLSFYQCLFYVDYFLSHIITEETTEKEILYYIVGYFICSSKLKETDIYEPSFESFVSIKKKVYLSVEKISLYEIKCLQSIKYNPFAYSAYDWICELISIGLVFNCEIEKSKSIILINGHRHSLVNVINKYTIKALLDITIKSIFLKYSPMHIAFSLIQITREKYLDENLINNDLYFKLINLYNIDFSDYEECYKEIKLEIEEKRKENNNENNNENNTVNNENDEEVKEKNAQDFCKKISTDFGSNAENNYKSWKSSGNIVRLKNKVVLSKQINNEYEHINNTTNKLISLTNDIKTINENDSININDKDNNISSINNNKNENLNYSSKNNIASIRDNSIKEIINDIKNKNEDEKNNNKEENELKENKQLEKIVENDHKSKNDSIDFIKENDRKMNNDSISFIKNEDDKINNNNDSIDFIINDDENKEKDEVKNKDKDKDIDSNKENIINNKNDSFTKKEKDINENTNNNDNIQIQNKENENEKNNESNNIVPNENENKDKNEDDKKTIGEEKININDNKAKKVDNINSKDINSKDENIKNQNDNNNNENKDNGNEAPKDNENLKNPVHDKGSIVDENIKEISNKIGNCDNDNNKNINDIKDNNIENKVDNNNNKDINTKNELKENKNKNENDINNGNKNDNIENDKNNEIKKENKDKADIKNNNNNVKVDDNKGINKNEKINMINENKNNIKKNNEENEKNEKEKNKNSNIIISNIKIKNSNTKNRKNNRYENNNIYVKSENNILSVNNGIYNEHKSIENKKEQKIKIKIKINKNYENKKSENKESEAKTNEKNENNKNENDDKKDKVNKNYNKNNEFSINMLLNEKKKKNILKKNYNFDIENNGRKKSLKENELINSQDVNFSKKNKINHFFISCDSNKNSSNDILVVSRFRKGNNNKIETNHENQVSPNKYQNLFLRANYANSNLKSNKTKTIKNTAEITVKINKRNKEFDFNNDIIKNWGNKEELELMKQYLSYESKNSSKKKDIHNLKSKPRNNVPMISNFDDLIKKYENNNSNINNKEDLKTYSSYSKRSIFKNRNKPNALFEREHQKILNENKRNKSTNHINRKIIKNSKDFIFAKNLNYNPKRKSLIKFTKLI